MGSGVVRNDPGQGRFAHSRRPMQTQLSDPVGLDGALEETSFGEDSLLTLEFLKGAWPHAIGEWCMLKALLLSVEGEKVLAHRRVVDESSVRTTTVIA
jgi:hypothetical protein